MTMTFTCCECEHHYEDGVSGDTDERMCYECLDNEEEDNIILGTDWTDSLRLMDELVEDAKEIVKKRKKEDKNE